MKAAQPFDSFFGSHIVSVISFLIEAL